MNTKSANKTTVLIFGIIIIIIQALDIFIHVRTDQAELIRILTNLVLILWVLLKIIISLPKKMIINLGALVLYLGMNILFIIFEGITNQNGDLRIILILLLFFTSLFSALFIHKSMLIEND